MLVNHKVRTIARGVNSEKRARLIVPVGILRFLLVSWHVVITSNEIFSPSLSQSSHRINISQFRASARNVSAIGSLS
jgi:hypothetical protein